MRIFFLVSIIILSMLGKVFAMNPLSQVAMNLKQNGYRQDIVVGDMIYSPNGDQYIKFSGDIRQLHPNWVKVPQTVEIMNELIDCQYSVAHSSTPDGNGGFKETWVLTDQNGMSFTSDNIWVVMSNYWMVKKGNK